MRVHDTMEDNIIAIFEALRPKLKDDYLIDWLISLFRLYVKRKAAGER